MLGSDRWRAFAAFQAFAVQVPSHEIGKMLARIDEQDTDRLAGFYARVAEAWSLDVVDGMDIADIATAALLIARSTIARIVARADVPHARQAYLRALGALVRGSFSARPGDDAEPERLLRESLRSTDD